MISYFPQVLGIWGTWGLWVQVWEEKWRENFRRWPWVIYPSFLGWSCSKFCLVIILFLRRNQLSSICYLWCVWVRGWKSVRHVSSVKVPNCSMFWELFLAVLCPVISLIVVDLPTETNSKLTTQVLLAWLLPRPGSIILSSSDYKAAFFSSYLLLWTCP